jgi:hypothetical protein
MTYGKAILGDNQFLGVNHTNQAKAAELYQRFSKPEAILEVLAAAYDAGVRDFMFTTHDRYEPVFDEIRRSNLFPGMHYTPCMPYAHKYWNQLSQKGAPSVLASTLFKANWLNVIPAGIGLLFGSMRGVVQLGTEIETLMCKGLPLRGIFLQNAAVDLLMAMEQYRFLEDFAAVVSRRTGVVPGFITMNHPKAVEVLCGRIGLDKPWICSNYNISGFRTNPGQTQSEASFASGRSHNIAMSVLSSNRASASESMGYVVERMNGGGIDAILFGSSSAQNIKSNFSRIAA